jgi:transcriptional regulator with XRE-family HTH domain
MKPVLSFDQKLGKIIRYHRRIVNFSQSKLAEVLDITPQQLQKYEKGRNKLNFEKVLKISQALNIPLKDLVEDMNEISQNEAYNSELTKESLTLLRNYQILRSDKLRKLLINCSRIFAEESNFNTPRKQY